METKKYERKEWKAGTRFHFQDFQVLRFFKSLYTGLFSSFNGRMEWRNKKQGAVSL